MEGGKRGRVEEGKGGRKGWKRGRGEGWKRGRVEGGKGGRREGWKRGRGGRVEGYFCYLDFCQDVCYYVLWFYVDGLHCLSVFGRCIGKNIRN